MDINAIGILLIYGVGTWVGYFMGKKTGIIQATDTAVNMLIERGYLRHRKTSDGEIELLKYNEENV